MQRVSRGYTIIEVMIFLAISVALLAAAMNLISGKQAETEFNQKMRDTRSKIQDWLNDVSTGFPGGDLQKDSCTAPGNSAPSINDTGSPSSSPECIFLGKAIQFTDTDSSYSQDESSNLYAYSVFGSRLDPSTGQIPDSLIHANPIAADARNGSGNVDLTETFSLQPAYVKSVTSTPLSSSHLIGFYTSFNTESSSLQNGNSDLNLWELNFGGSAKPGNDPGGSQVNNCIQLKGGCGSPVQLNSYVFCLTDGHRAAQITISSGPSGIGAQTSLDYVTTCP